MDNRFNPYATTDLNNNNTNDDLVISKSKGDILRHLTSDDAMKAKELAVISFPIYYPLAYFMDSFNDKAHYFSTGIISTKDCLGSLEGFIIALPNYCDDTSRCQFYSKPEKSLILQFNSKLAYICSLAVHPDSMRKGLGTRLISSVIEACKGWNPSPLAIFLHVKSDNLKAMTFYKRNGFAEWAFIKDYYNENSHAYIYVRILEQPSAST